jgi:hypothetical protein
MSNRLDELQTEYKASQSEEVRKQIHDELAKRAEFTFDLNNLPQVTHRWVDRGEVMSCEGAGHANHRHFKFRR